ncbi:hypothetical protein AB0H42_06145, partial [Nocardia sp. NPDC050799]|uniref:hypothetical protein n=1 Tax=Nocardia sp. NPDC050799 TaxID=3154842 RepID=UPI0033C49D9F
RTGHHPETDRTATRHHHDIVEGDTRPLDSEPSTYQRRFDSSSYVFDAAGCRVVDGRPRAAHRLPVVRRVSATRVVFAVDTAG